MHKMHILFENYVLLLAGLRLVIFGRKKTGPCEGRTHDRGAISTTFCRLS